MYSEKYALYFIDESHEKNYEVLLKKFTQAKTNNEYECAIYVVSLPEIFEKINGEPGQYPFAWVHAIEEIERIEYDEENDERIVVSDVKILRENKYGTADFSDAYYSLSSSYQSIISLGLELYGNTNEGFQILDAISNYDDNLYKVFIQLLNMRKMSRRNVEGLEINIE
ncbi:DUF2538 family protein [Lentibacillus cibarius]|uniref:DUF2538 family protein n=1 Tax=Lentibacillus cibarius TaxID=2583219 RepID=A0A549Y8U8_9BACI|nr:DUF2538 family protein [Lentibacillus cibarius]TRM08325.1 DUF2538 family protein [Lentibacillus cibarius]